MVIKTVMSPLSPSTDLTNMQKIRTTTMPSCRFFFFLSKVFLFFERLSQLTPIQHNTIAPNPTRRATAQLMSLAQMKLFLLSARSGIDA